VSVRASILFGRIPHQADRPGGGGNKTQRLAKALKTPFEVLRLLHGSLFFSLLRRLLSILNLPDCKGRMNTSSNVQPL
jgi:hypothetical protein